MKMSTKHCKYVLSFSTSNKPIKPAQAQKKTKHNVTKHWQAPKKSKKQNKKKRKISYLWGSRVLSRWWDFAFWELFGACQCFVRLCFVFCFFGACQCFSSIITKQDANICVSPRFQSHQMQKTSVFIYSVLCSCSFKNHVPMVPRSQQKKIGQHSRCYAIFVGASYTLW